MDTQEQQDNLDKARGIVLLNMTFSGALNDETMPAEKMEIFGTKRFSEWPKEMQDQLAPFGAKLIQ